MSGDGEGHLSPVDTGVFWGGNQDSSMVATVKLSIAVTPEICSRGYASPEDSFQEARQATLSPERDVYESRRSVEDER